MCDYCADLHPTVRIKTPQKLSKMLLRAARSGYVIDTDPQGNRHLHGWYDFLQHHFQCTHCNAVFEIDAETYHGRGGKWKMLEVASKRFPAT